MKLRAGQFVRLLFIQRVLVRHGLDELVLGIHLFRPIQFLFYMMPWNWFNKRKQTPIAGRILHALEDLGPLFVKFGQVMSTRRDLLPEDIANSLAKLQDDVPPFDGEQARQIIERELGKPIDELFSSFDIMPLASASIAQVHAARLKNGDDVVIKVVRPDIEEVIRRDIGLMYVLAELAENYLEHGKRLKPVGVVREFERTLLDELDLLREAANASQLRRNFIDDPRFYVPAIDWELSRRSVLVMERIRGIPINDLVALEDAGVDLKELAEMGVELFFRQVFQDRYFHADIHPGNLFVEPAKDDHPLRILPVDFGIMGSLSDNDQRYLADNFLAFLSRDYRRVALLHVESGWVPADTRVDEFEFAIRAVSEPMLERSLSEMSIGQLLYRLFQTAQRFHMEILPQLLLLQKTLVNIEGVGRMLYPELDLWESARPVMKRWMSERVGARRLVSHTKENLPLLIERLPEVPGLLLDVLDQAHQSKKSEHQNEQQLLELHQAMVTTNRRTINAIVGSALLVVSAIVYGFGDSNQLVFDLAPLSVWISGLVGAAFLISALRE